MDSWGDGRGGGGCGGGEVARACASECMPSDACMRMRDADADADADVDGDGGGACAGFVEGRMSNMTCDTISKQAHKAFCGFKN